MRHPHVLAFSAFVFATAGASVAFAQTCEDSWERAQTLLKQNRLVDARVEYRACVNACVATTPAEMEASKDCSASLSKIEQDIPTVIFFVTNGKGDKLTDVSVVMDGKSIASRLDGNAVEVDPGAHSFVLTHESTTKTLEWTVDEGRRNQEIKAVFDTAPAAAAPAANPSARHVAFSTADDGAWELASAEGKAMCQLPCTADLDPDKGYQVRVKGGSTRSTFLGSAATGPSATVTPPSGNKTAATITVVTSAIVASVGAGLYFAGNTQKCGYGKHKDADGNEVYSLEVKGSCPTDSAPSGYVPGSGEDTGDTAKGNQKFGIAMGIAGGAGVIVGGVWWLMSSSTPTLSWSPKAASGASDRRMSFVVGPTSVGMRGTW